MEITKEVKEAMLGLLPFSEDAVDEFVPARFKVREGVPKNMIPTIRLKMLTRAEKKKAVGILKTFEKRDEDELEEFARKKTVGWDSMHDLATGEEIKFEADDTGAAKKDVFARLNRTMVGDIFYRLVKTAGLIDLEVTGLRF